MEKNQIVYILYSDFHKKEIHRTTISGIYFNTKLLAEAITLSIHNWNYLVVETMYANKINNEGHGLVWRNQASDIVNDPELFEQRVQKHMNDDLAEVRESL